MTKNLPQSNQLLGASGVNSDTAIKVLLSSTHLHSDTESLQHLANAQTKDVQADDLFLRASADNLHLGGVLGLLLGGQNGVVHSSELSVVDLDLVVAVALTGLGFGETDNADLGVGEDDGRDVLIRKLGVLELGSTEETVTKLATSGNCNYQISQNIMLGL